MPSLISKIHYVSAPRESTVGPSYDPYSRETFYVTLKCGRKLEYVCCSLSRPLPDVVDSKGLPTLEQVIAWRQRYEAKRLRRAAARYRRAGLSKRAALKRVREDEWVASEMASVVASNF